MARGNSPQTDSLTPRGREPHQEAALGDFFIAFLASLGDAAQRRFELWQDA